MRQVRVEGRGSAARERRSIALAAACAALLVGVLPLQAQDKPSKTGGAKKAAQSSSMSSEGGQCIAPATGRQPDRAPPTEVTGEGERW